MTSIDPNRLNVLALALAKTDDIASVLSIRWEIMAFLAELSADKPRWLARGGERANCGGDPN